MQSLEKSFFCDFKKKIWRGPRRQRHEHQNHWFHIFRVDGLLSIIVIYPYLIEGMFRDVNPTSQRLNIKYSEPEVLKSDISYSKKIKYAHEFKHKNETLWTALNHNF